MLAAALSAFTISAHAEAPRQVERPGTIEPTGIELKTQADGPPRPLFPVADTKIVTAKR